MAVPSVLNGPYTQYGNLTNSMQLGAEVRNPKAYGTCYRFKNWCKSATGWAEYTVAAPWTGTGGFATLTDAGYPASIGDGILYRSEVQAVWSSVDGNGGYNAGTFPAGEYVFTYTGTVGSISIDGSGISDVTATAGRIEFTSDGTATMSIIMSGTISVALDEFVICEAKYEGDWEAGDYWYPESLLELEGLKCLEFEAWYICATWLTTSTQFTWEQTRSKGYYCYHDQPVYGSPDRNTAGKDWRAIPYELQIDLCNRLTTGYWITIPLRASDAYITSLATYVKTNLHSAATVHIELGVEPFFDGELVSPLTQGAKWCFDEGTNDGYANPQLDWYVARAEAVFTLFKATDTTHTVKASVASGIQDAGSNFRTGWIANLVESYTANKLTSIDGWATGLYTASSILAPTAGGLGKTWAEWAALIGTQTGVDDINDAITNALLTGIAAFDVFLAAMSSTGLDVGLYEFGQSASVDNFTGLAESVREEADGIGDLLRSALDSEDEYWRTLYYLNAVHDRCRGMCIYYSAAAGHLNAVPWGMSDTNIYLTNYIADATTLPYTDHERYYILKEFVRPGTATTAASTIGYPTGVLRIPGSIVINPTDLSAAYPYGGYEVGKVKMINLQPMGTSYRVECEGLGNISDVLEPDHKYMMSFFVRGWSDNAIQKLFPRNFLAGSVSGHSVFQEPGTSVPGMSSLGRTVKVLFAPDDLLHAPAILVYNGLPHWIEGSEMIFQRSEEFGLPIAIECLRDLGANILQVGMLADLSLS